MTAANRPPTGKNGRQPPANLYANRPPTCRHPRQPPAAPTPHTPTDANPRARGFLLGASGPRANTLRWRSACVDALRLNPMTNAVSSRPTSNERHQSKTRSCNPVVRSPKNSTSTAGEAWEKSSASPFGGIPCFGITWRAARKLYTAGTSWYLRPQGNGEG
jgi:hypothetical protein